MVATDRSQRTLNGPAEVSGTGFLTGAMVTLRFCPAPPATGIVFVRNDLPGYPRVRAHIDQVIGTDRRTTIGQGSCQVSLVEHVMAALAGLQIDNCYVEINAPEPPGLDGSSAAFVKALQKAGVVQQPARKRICKISESIVVSIGKTSLAIHPSPGNGLTISYFLDYGLVSPIARQIYTQTINPTNFAQEIAPSRTFLLESEALELHRQGLGSRTTTSDLIIFGPKGPLDNSLRWANEPARHKTLDIIGDLAMLGMDLMGHVVAYRSGHHHNAQLVKAIQQKLQETQIVHRRAA